MHKKQLEKERAKLAILEGGGELNEAMGGAPQRTKEQVQQSIADLES